MISLHVFVTDFIAVISSQSEGLGKMALGIVKIYLGLPFPANQRCTRSVCLRSVGSRSVCGGQLSWTQKSLLLLQLMKSALYLVMIFSPLNPLAYNF